MYAIVEIGDKQYKVAKDSQLLIEKIAGLGKQKLTLDKVLLIGQDKKVKIGTPYLKNVKVDCELIAHLKGKKKIAFKFRRRKNSDSKRGHRQKLVKIKVKDITNGT